ncbi:polysaccharide biosynthesis/export family protein [Fulvivirga sp. M361]|uniref:polysaccharide biosynthesis/export family protein n=1 Tax=Fulvivirga sp. M361 TaxID=2594266 RepID=UPI001626210B|nr:polysaccharide biosynthesis/export family protein [Fulvivirga sp. M361]
MCKYLTFIGIGVLLIVSSCVPNRKTVLLQYEDELEQENYPTDTTLRSYKPDRFDYRIQPEDVLSVKVLSLTREEYDFFNETNDTNLVNQGQQGGIVLSGYLVDYNGEIEFPVVNKIKVAGLTIHEAQKLIQSKAMDFLKEPVVRVRLLNFRVTLLGEVAQEGVISVFNNRTNIIEAVGLAGGLDDLADRSKVKILRHENGTVNVYYINLLDEDLVNSPYYYVHNNDVIIVPPLKQKPFRQYLTQNFTLVISTLSLLFLTINLFN